MKYDEFKRRVKDIEIQNAIISMLEDTRILSIQMHNVQHEFEQNNIHGFTSGTINTFNDEHKIMLDTLKHLNVLVCGMNCDLSGIDCLVKQLLVDYEHGNYEFEE